VFLSRLKLKGVGFRVLNILCKRLSVVANCMVQCIVCCLEKFLFFM